MSERDKDTEESSEDQEDTIARDVVITKYSAAADIVNAVLSELIQQCQPGQSVKSLCTFGDNQMIEKASKVFKKKDLKKGIAFPTCISVNNCACHFSPLQSEPDVTLAAGDLVKLDFAAHVDGFIASVGHSLVVPGVEEQKISGRNADAMLAAHYALEAAVRMLRPESHKNTDISDVVERIAAAYDCRAVENMVSYSLKRFKIDGPVQIVQRPAEKQRLEIEKHDFENYEVYAIGVYVSTGEGKAKQSTNRTTVYKRNEDVVYQLKMKASRAFFSDLDRRFGFMGFTLRSFDDEVKAKLGVNECEKHNLLKPFHVLYEREGDVVAHFKTTVLILPSGLIKITGLPFKTELYESTHKIENSELLRLLKMSLKNPKKPKKKEPVVSKQPTPTSPQI